MRDEDYVEEAFHSSYRRLVGQLYLVCGDLPTAEDIVAEAFVRAVARAKTFRKVDNPEAWLSRVALNIHHSRWRRLQTLARVSRRVDPSPNEVEIGPDHVALVEALRTLPAAQREAIVMYHLADRSIGEVAATLEIPEGTLKARLARARAALADLLRDPPDDRATTNARDDSEEGHHV